MKTSRMTGVFRHGTRLPAVFLLVLLALPALPSPAGAGQIPPSIIHDPMYQLPWTARRFLECSTRTTQLCFWGQDELLMKLDLLKRYTNYLDGYNYGPVDLDSVWPTYAGHGGVVVWRDSNEYQDGTVIHYTNYVTDITTVYGRDTFRGWGLYANQLGKGHPVTNTWKEKYWQGDYPPDDPADEKYGLLSEEDKARVLADFELLFGKPDGGGGGGGGGEGEGEEEEHLNDTPDDTEDVSSRVSRETGAFNAWLRLGATRGADWVSAYFLDFASTWPETDLERFEDLFTAQAVYTARKALAISRANAAALTPGEDTLSYLDDQAAGLAFWDSVAATPWIAVLRKGSCQTLSALLSEINVPTAWVDPDFDPAALLADHPALLIPSGGLAGLERSDLFKEKLAAYAALGGTVVCFSQPYGENFSALPGGGVGGFGWNQDQSCQFASANIERYKPFLAAVTKVTPDFNVDGFFMAWPDEAETILTRTANGRPCMIQYPWGQGRVLATTLFLDQAWSLSQMTGDERDLTRGLAAWARDPDALSPAVEAAPGGALDLTLTVSNPSAYSTATLLTIYVVSPNGARSTGVELPMSLAPGASAQVPWTCQLPGFGYGIYSLDGSLSDSGGNLLGNAFDAAVFASASFAENPGGWEARNNGLTFSVQSDRETYFLDTTARFTVLCWNTTDAERRVRVRYYLDRHRYVCDPGPPEPCNVYTAEEVLLVPAHGQARADVDLPIRQVCNCRDRFIVSYRDADTGETLGSGLKTVWLKPARLAASVETDRDQYARGEAVAVTLTFASQEDQTVGFTGETRTYGPSGELLDSRSFSLEAPADGEAVTSFTWTLPWSAGEGTYRIYAHDDQGGMISAHDQADIRVSQYAALAVETGRDPAVYAAGEAFPVTVTVQGFVSTYTETVLSLDLLGMDFSEERNVSLDPANPRTFLFSPRLFHASRADDPAGDAAHAWQDVREAAALAGAGETAFTMELAGEVPLSPAGALEYTWTADVNHDGTPDGAVVLAFDPGTGWEARLSALSAELSDVGPFTDFTVAGNAVAVTLTSAALHMPHTMDWHAETGEDRAPDAGESSLSRPAGRHVLSVDLGTDITLDTREVEIFLRNPELAWEAGNLSNLSAGDPVALTLVNSGGEDVYAGYEVVATDDKGAVFASSSGHAPVPAGGAASVTLNLPGQAANRNCRLMASASQEDYRAQAWLYRTFPLAGVSGSLSLSGLADLYNTGTATDASVRVQNTGERDLSDATLKAAVLRSVRGTSGITFSSGDLPQGVDPAALASDGAFVYAFSNDDSGIHMQRRDLEGGEWTGDALVPGPGAPGAVTAVASAADREGNLWMAFAETGSGVYVTRSQDLGQGWSDRALVAAPGAAAWYLELAVGPEGNLYTTWMPQGGGIFFSRSADLGETWSEAALVSGNLDANNWAALYVARNGNILVGFPDHHQDSQTYTFHYSRSTDQGGSWEGPFQVPGFSATTEVYSMVVEDTQGVLYAASLENDMNLVGVAFAVTDPDTGEWGEKQILVQWPFGLPLGLWMTATADDRIFLFFDRAGEVFLIQAEDGGGTLSEPSADGLPENSGFPILAQDPDGVYLSKGGTLTLGLLGTGREVWSSETTVSAQAGAFTDVAVSCPGVEEPGNYHLALSLVSASGQTLDKMTRALAVSDEGFFVTLDTDREAYVPGRTAVISGEVDNRSGAGANFTLRLTRDNGELLSQDFFLADNETRPFETSTMADASFNLMAVVNGYVAAREVLVADPALSASVTAPDALGRDRTYEVGFSLENTGEVAVDEEVTARQQPEGGTETVYGPWTVRLEPGETWSGKADVATHDTPPAETLWTLAAAGDLAVTATARSAAGEDVQTCLDAEALYLDRPFTVSATFENAGTLDSGFTAAFLLDGEPLSESSVLAPAGQTAGAEISLSPAEGGHVLSCQTPFGATETTFTVAALEAEISGEAAFASARLLPGRTESFSFTLTNTGATGGLGEVTLSLPGLYEETSSVFVPAGESAPLTFTFTAPEDLDTRTGELTWTLSGESHVAPLDMEGFAVNVTASLDQDYYEEGKNARLTVTVENLINAELPGQVRVQLSDWLEMRPLTLAGNALATESFDVPVAFDGAKLCFGVYHESGRALYLNAFHLRELAEIISLASDRQQYALADPVAITVTTAEPGTLTLTAPHGWAAFSPVALPAGETVIPWSVPAEEKTGTHTLGWEFASASGTVTNGLPLDVDGYRIRVERARADGEEKGSAGSLGLSFLLDAGPEMDARVKVSIRDSGGGRVGSLDEIRHLSLGENDLSLEIPYQAGDGGLFSAFYGLYSDLSGHSEVLMASGALYFDVSDTAAPEVLGAHPTDGTPDAPTDGLLQIRFSEAMDAASAEAAFTLAPPAPGAFTWVGGTALFAAANGLAPRTAYTATLSAAARDEAGNALAAPYSWTFSTTFLDADHDKMDDEWEAAHGLDPGDPADAALDPDDDGLDNLSEFTAQTDPRAADSDHDGLPDGWEVAQGLDPLAADPFAGPGDLDGDGAVGVADAVMAARITAGIEPAERVYTPGDPDGDGQIGPPDTLFILQKTAGSRP